MMQKAFKVTVLQRATDDVDSIYAWLMGRSPSGAAQWYSYFLEAASSLATEPERCAISIESERVGVPVRDRFFKTPSGRVYRIVFLVSGAEVRILRVRGPGQPPLKSSDLES
jgi:plasmid stabilization system protein ParE